MPTEMEKLEAEIQNLKAETKKLAIDAEIAEESRIKNNFFRTFPVTQLTVIIASITFLFQSLQVIATGYIQRQSRVESEWRSAVRSFSTADSAKALSGALNLETFYDDPKYSGKAKELVIASLAKIDNPNQFNTVLSVLFRSVEKEKSSGLLHAGADDTRLIYIADTSVGDAYESLYSRLAFPNENPAFPVSFERTLVNLERIANKPDGDEAARRESEIDTLTTSIIKYWHRFGLQAVSMPDPGKIPKKCAPSSYTAAAGLILKEDQDDDDYSTGILPMDHLDFSCMVFKRAFLARADLSNSVLDRAVLEHADLSHANLTGTSMRCVDVTKTDLSRVANFSGSDWTGSKWDTRTVSPELAGYLRLQVSDTRNRHICD